MRSRTCAHFPNRPGHHPSHFMLCTQVQKSLQTSTSSQWTGAEYSKHLHARSLYSGVLLFLNNFSQRDIKRSLLYNLYYEGKAVRMCPPPHNALSLPGFLSCQRTRTLLGMLMLGPWVRNTDCAVLSHPRRVFGCFFMQSSCFRLAIGSETATGSRMLLHKLSTN